MRLFTLILSLFVAMPLLAEDRPCQTDRECLFGEFCGGGLFGLGQSYCQPQLPDGSACASARHCESGACNVVCYSPEAKQLGEPCKVNQECRDSKCSAVLWGATRGVCVCDGNEDCPVGQYCYKGIADIGTNECREPLPDGKVCTGDTDCQSGHCNVVCYTPGTKEFGEACQVSEECRIGGCSSVLWGVTRGSCVCTEDAHCGPGNYCDKGFADVGTNYCRALRQRGEGCSQDYQCASGACTRFYCE